MALNDCIMSMTDCSWLKSTAHFRSKYKRWEDSVLFSYMYISFDRIYILHVNLKVIIEKSKDLEYNVILK